MAVRGHRLRLGTPRCGGRLPRRRPPALPPVQRRKRRRAQPSLHGQLRGAPGVGRGGMGPGRRGAARRGRVRSAKSMNAWDAIVEAKIAQAQQAGAFDDLPGAGKPLDLADDRLVPEDVRVAYRILRNAGYVPVELIERKEAADLRKLVASIAADDSARRRALAKLALLEARLAARPATRRGSGGCP